MVVRYIFLIRLHWFQSKFSPLRINSLKLGFVTEICKSKISKVQLGSGRTIFEPARDLVFISKAFDLHIKISQLELLRNLGQRLSVEPEGQ